jgi:hypothetical protein
LVDNTKCKLRLHTSKEHISKKLTTNINIVFTPFIKFDLLKYPIEDGLTIRGINRTIKEKITENDFMDKNNEQIQAITKKNTELEQQQQQMCIMASNKFLIVNTLNMPIGNFKKLIDAQNNIIFYVFAFKEITTKFGPQRILLCSSEKELTEKTEKTVLSVYWATSVINSYIDKFKAKWKCIDFPIYGSLSGVIIFKFR